MCISWTVKGLISLMHGITMKITCGMLPSGDEFYSSELANYENGSTNTS